MGGTCTVTGCEQPTVGRGWCRRHYNNWHRSGEPTAPPTARLLPLTERFLALVEQGQGDDCWPWLGRLDPHGSPSPLKAGGRKYPPRRVAWEMAHPDGPAVKPSERFRERPGCHPLCCRPSHMLRGGGHNAPYRSRRLKGRRCSVDDCPDLASSRGMCRHHYNQWGYQTMRKVDMTIVDGYEAEPGDVAAMLDQEIDAEDRDDPTLLYIRATQVAVRYSTALAELTKVRAEALHRLSLDGMSYAEIAQHVGLSRARIQQLVRLGRGQPLTTRKPS